MVGVLLWTVDRTIRSAIAWLLILIPGYFLTKERPFETFCFWRKIVSYPFCRNLNNFKVSFKWALAGRTDGSSTLLPAADRADRIRAFAVIDKKRFPLRLFHKLVCWAQVTCSKSFAHSSKSGHRSRGRFWDLSGKCSLRIGISLGHWVDRGVPINLQYKQN